MRAGKDNLAIPFIGGKGRKNSILGGCSKRPFSKAAGESKPEAYPLGYVEDFDEPRTQLAGFFSSLLLRELGCLPIHDPDSGKDQHDAEDFTCPYWFS